MKYAFTTIFVLVAFMAVSTLTFGAPILRFEATLSTAQEVPTPVPGNITAANVRAVFDEGLTRVEVKLTVDGGGNVLAAHFHCQRAGVAGPVVFGLFSPGPLTFDGQVAAGILTNADFTGADCRPLIGRPINNIAALALAMKNGLIYVNVHTVENGPGEVRGQLLEAAPRRRLLR